MEIGTASSILGPCRSLDIRIDRASPESQPWLQTHTWRVAPTTCRLYPFPLWARTTRLTPAAEDFPRTRPQGSGVQGLDVAGNTVQFCSDKLLSPYKGSLFHRHLCGGITDSPPRPPVHNHRGTNISSPYGLSGQSLMYTVLHKVTLVTTHTLNPQNVVVDHEVFKARSLDLIDLLIP